MFLHLPLGAPKKLLLGDTLSAVPAVGISVIRNRNNYRGDMVPFYFLPHTDILVLWFFVEMTLRISHHLYT